MKQLSTVIHAEKGVNNLGVELPFSMQHPIITSRMITQLLAGENLINAGNRGCLHGKRLTESIRT